jgi:hypothetical protein
VKRGTGENVVGSLGDGICGIGDTISDIFGSYDARGSGDETSDERLVIRREMGQRHRDDEQPPKTKGKERKSYDIGGIKHCNQFRFF